MHLIRFETAVIARASSGDVLVALIDGEPERCVGLFSCQIETARALCRALGSVMKEPQ